MVYAPPTWQIDPKAVKRIAVLQGNALHLYRHTDPRSTSVPRLVGTTDMRENVDLAKIVSTLIGPVGCAALWLLPNGAHPNSSDHPIIARWPVSGYEATIYAGDYDLTAHEISSEGHLAGLVFQRKDGGIPFGVYAPWVNNAWGIDDLLPLASDMLSEGLALAAYAMGAQLRFSPSYTGLSVLRDTLRGVDLPQMSPEREHGLRPARLGGDLQPSYIQWRREITPEETYFQGDPTGSLALYKYDRISSFLASARELPVGDPIPTGAFRPHLPGIYRINAYRSHLTGHSNTEPGVFRVGPVGEVGEYPESWSHYTDGAVWAWEPQVRLAMRQGDALDIAEGYYWPKLQRRDFMRDWQQRMWLARKEAEVAWSRDQVKEIASKIATRIIKKAGVTTIGRLNQNEGYGVTTKSEAREKGYQIVSREVDDQGMLTGNVTAQMPMGRTDLYLPAVWSTIIANANERLQSLSYAYPGDTMLQYIDAAYMLHRHPEIEQPGHLGKFKLERTLAIPVADLDRVNTMSPYDLTVYLAGGGRDISFFEDGDQEPEDGHGE